MLLRLLVVVSVGVLIWASVNAYFSLASFGADNLQPTIQGGTVKNGDVVGIQYKQYSGDGVVRGFDKGFNAYKIQLCRDGTVTKKSVLGIFTSYKCVGGKWVNNVYVPK